MSPQNESDDEELRRLKEELASRDEEVELPVAAASAKREISDVRHLAREECEQIDQLQEDAATSLRIERAQRALIAELRAEAGEEECIERELGARLRAAELELVWTCARFAMRCCRQRSFSGRAWRSRRR